MTMAAVREVALHRRLLQDRNLYAMQLLWMLGAQVFMLGGGGEYPMPEPGALFAGGSCGQARGRGHTRRFADENEVRKEEDAWLTCLS